MRPPERRPHSFSTNYPPERLHPFSRAGFLLTTSWWYTFFMLIKPDDCVRMLGVHEGMRIADIGAGSGAHALLLGRAVGTSGEVYAIDVQPALVEKIARDAHHAGLLTIHAVLGDSELPGGTKLAGGSIDRVLLSNALFQIENRLSLAKEIARILRPNGKLLVVDWTDTQPIIGPRAESRVSKEAARAVFERAGLSFVSEHDAGEQQYAMLFSKA